MSQRHRNHALRRALRKKEEEKRERQLTDAEEQASVAQRRRVKELQEKRTLREPSPPTKNKKSSQSDDSPWKENDESRDVARGAGLAELRNDASASPSVRFKDTAPAPGGAAKKTAPSPQSCESCAHSTTSLSSTKTRSGVSTKPSRRSKFAADSDSDDESFFTLGVPQPISTGLANKRTTQSSSSGGWVSSSKKPVDNTRRRPSDTNDAREPARRTSSGSSRESEANKRPAAKEDPVKPKAAAKRSNQRRVSNADDDSSDDDDFNLVALVTQSTQSNKTATLEEKETMGNQLCATDQTEEDSQSQCPMIVEPVQEEGLDDQPALDECTEELVESPSPQKTASRRVDASIHSPASVDATKRKILSPRNPLTLMREDSLLYSGSMPPRASAEGHAELSRSLDDKIPPKFRTKETGDDDLWSDSDDDQKGSMDESSAPARKKRKASNKTKKTKAQPDDDAPPKQQAKKPNAETKPSTKRTAAASILNYEEEAVGCSRDELHPEFEQPKFGPFGLEPFHLGGSDGVPPCKIPASINRYLMPYQREGVEFMYNLISQDSGVILGDDMGLGKTIQIISLLAALLEKTGTGQDKYEIQQRRKYVANRLAELQAERARAIAAGIAPTDEINNLADEAGRPRWAPILVLPPPGVLDTWLSAFKDWGHFAVAEYRKVNTREVSLAEIQHGSSEILCVPHSLFQQSNCVSELGKIKWQAIVVDEFHTFKSKDSKWAKHLRLLKSKLQKPRVIALTGTLMQNDHEELWNLVDMVEENFLGSWAEFKSRYAAPIKLARSKDATLEVQELGSEMKEEISGELHSIRLRRTKKTVLADQLPEKEEVVIFCALSDLQKRLYQHILKQPDFVLMKFASAPCDCGVNTKFFQEYKNLPTRKQRVSYLRRHKKEIVHRGECCYVYPRDSHSPDGIAPRAVIWRQLASHSDGEPCKSCPRCLGFPCLHVLYKLSSHVSLLQVKHHPDTLEEGTRPYEETMDKLEMAKVFLPKKVLPELPGGSYFQDDSVMDDHAKLSGKMKVVDMLLRKIDRKQEGRVLLFSFSTAMLDIIENYVRMRYSYRRMDGSTGAKERKRVEKEFQSDPSIFILLLSTKAMALGLNLTGANNVIIFDVEWNPSYDCQAQDRTYRIGQEKNVNVYRLVARGTVEELKYLRQVYKNQLKNETITDAEQPERATSERYFRGVAGDKDRKGELFGYVNLLRFNDGTFMDYGKGSGGADNHRVSDVTNRVNSLTQEDFDDIGGGADVVQDISDRPVGTRQQNVNPEGDESVSEFDLGGESQVGVGVCEDISVPLEPPDNGGLSSIPELQEAEGAARVLPSPTVRPASVAPKDAERDGDVALEQNSSGRAEPSDGTPAGPSSPVVAAVTNGSTSPQAQLARPLDDDIAADASDDLMMQACKPKTEVSGKWNGPLRRVTAAKRKAPGARKKASKTTFSVRDLPVPS